MNEENCRTERSGSLGTSRVFVRLRIGRILAGLSDGLDVSHERGVVACDDVDDGYDYGHVADDIQASQ